MKSKFLKIGFMQGRLSPLVDDKIQAFPWDSWEAELPAASALGIKTMEWTVDYENLYKNPLMTLDGRNLVKSLCHRNGISIPSLTGDCFMQAPFWKRRGRACLTLQNDFRNILDSCYDLGITYIVLPLVDSGSIETAEQESKLFSYLLSIEQTLIQYSIKIAFESDFSPNRLKEFIGKLPEKSFGINYDSGNSAALGYDPMEEFSSYGNRIINVHIKDRLLGGNTVPLGTGNTDFESVFQGLANLGYDGNFILQTARAADGDHRTTLLEYYEMVRKWIIYYGF